MAALTALTALPAAASAVAPQRQTGRPFFDARNAPQSLGAQPIILPAQAAAAAALGRELGPQGVASLDPRTGTPRKVARLDGFLTGKSASSPAVVALGYVRGHRNVFGLSDAALAALRTPSPYVSIDGTTHLRWAQLYHGVPVFDNELRANVDRYGRLINVLGSPLTDTAVGSTEPRLSASAALELGRADAGATGVVPAMSSASNGPERTTRFADRSQADVIIFHLSPGNRLAWHLYVNVDSTHTYEYLIDATSGRVLFRDNVVVAASGEGSAWFYNPSPLFGPSNGLVDGHTQALRAYPDSWGPISSTELGGNNVYAFNDWNDNGQVEANKVVAPTGFGAEGHPIFNYPWVDLSSSALALNCSSNFPCSWESQSPTSWQINRQQNATQVFWFVNNFKDHLEAAPIGFTPAAGNFQFDNHGQGGAGGDPVLAETSDGAETSPVGGPDENHVNNANMLTQQDGVPPRMQMYLFTGFGFVDANGGDEADIVYHEYTHGLSNRLITDALGFPRLEGPQAGAMGEAWSDWYAMDYLVSQNLETDTSAPGDVKTGVYISQGASVVRSMAMDCPVGVTGNPSCTNKSTGHQGGYTLADFGKICCGGPEVHADGEIWGQTLWQMRQALQATPGTCSGPCAPKAEQLVTRAMEISPTNPSMLDERDAILQADQTDFAGADLNTIFAQRGMGYFASTQGSEDTSPVADFHTPPLPSFSITSPANGASYVQGQAVAASYSCSAPAGATITSCSGPVASGKAIDTTTLGSHSFTVNATDSQGFGATQTVTYSVAAGPSTGSATGGSATGGGFTGGGPSVGVLGSQVLSVSSAQIAALLARQLTPSGKAAKIAALLKSGRFTVTFEALEAGTAVISWYYLPPGAKLAQKATRKPVLVASGRLTLSTAEAATIKLKLTAKGKQLLKHLKHIKLTAKGTFTPTGKATVTALRTFEPPRVSWRRFLLSVRSLSRLLELSWGKPLAGSV